MVIVLSQQEVFATTTISQFAEGSALEQAGAQVGDTIKEIDGYAVLSERDLTFALALADPEAVSMEVERQGRRVDLGTFPLHTQTLEDGSQMVTLDFYVQPEEVTVLSVLRRGVTDTLSMARMVWRPWRAWSPAGSASTTWRGPSARPRPSPRRPAPGFPRASARRC